MKTKFVLSILLVVVMIIVSACGNNQSENTTKNSEPKSAGTEAAKDAESSKEVEKEQTAVDYFNGKNIEFIVPYAPGGGYDLYPRLLSKYIEKNTGAKAVVIKNIDGGGGLLGINELYKAKPDGFTVGIMNGFVDIVSQLGEVGGAQYDMNKFSYIGRVDNARRVLYVKPDIAAMPLKEIIESQKELIVSVTQKGSSPYVDAYMSSEALGLKYKYILGAKGGGEHLKLFLSGDVNAGWSSWDPQMKDLVDNKEGVILLQSGKERHPDLPDVSTLYEAAEQVGTDQNVVDIIEGLTTINEAGRIIAAPPGVPENVLEFLREALIKSLEDPEFIAEAEQSGAAIDYVDGNEIAEIVNRAFSLPEFVMDPLLKAIKGE